MKQTTKINRSIQLFPNSTPAYPFRGAGCYLMTGKVVQEFGFASLEVLKFAKLPILGNPVMG